MPKKIKLKNKPKKPIKEKTTIIHTIHQGTHVPINIFPPNSTIFFSYYNEVYVQYEEEESEERFIERNKEYIKKLQEYNQWVVENEEDIKYTKLLNKEKIKNKTVE